MMLIIKIFCFFLFFVPISVYSCNLTKELNNFLRKEYSLQKNNINVIIHTKLKKDIYCAKPLFVLLNNSHSFGLINVLFTCGKIKQYLQVELQVIGKYIAAKRFIPRGTKINEKDITVLIGRLDILPIRTYLFKKDVLNTVNIHDLFPLQPITSAITHPFWLVKINQLVNVIIYGANFTVKNTGKVLNNAYQNQIAYVKINTNNILSGIVNHAGEVIVNI